MLIFHYFLIFGSSNIKGDGSPTVSFSGDPRVGASPGAAPARALSPLTLLPEQRTQHPTLTSQRVFLKQVMDAESLAGPGSTKRTDQSQEPRFPGR